MPPALVLAAALGDLTFGQAVGAIALVFGLAAAVHQLVNAFRRRRFDRAEERILALVAKEIDAEDAEREYAKYQALRASLRKQVEEEVPREARRVYLRSRVEALRTQLESDHEEYERVLRELRELAPDETVGALDERLRSVIEDSIRPQYVRRRRYERLVLALLIALVVLPLSPLSFAFFVIPDFLASLGDPGNSSPAEVAPAIVVSMLAVAAMVVPALRWLSARGISIATPTRWSFVSASLLLMGGASLLVGAAIANNAGEAAARRIEVLDREYELARGKTGELKDAPSNQQTLKRHGKAVAAQTRKLDGDYQRAGTLLSVGVPVTGVALGLLLGLLSIRWRVPRRR